MSPFRPTWIHNFRVLSSSPLTGAGPRAMWCAKCQSDVAVEARQSSQRLHCAICGSEITPRLHVPKPLRSQQTNPESVEGVAAPIRGPNAIRPKQGHDAQELLARWAGREMFDPYGPIPTAEAGNAVHPPEPTLDQVLEPAVDLTPTAPEITIPQLSGRTAQQAAHRDPAVPQKAIETPEISAKVRIDSAFSQGWNDVPAPHVHAGMSSHPEQESIAVTTTDSSSNVEAAPPQPAENNNAATRHPKPIRRFDPPENLRGPHFDPAKLRHGSTSQSLRWAAIFGQVLAYIGAATLTGGAGLVLWGYLGGPQNMAPTGWFTTIVGQMLLFMGVVTLVSAGMEQTTSEVTRRVDLISEQLNRLEHVTSQPNQNSDADVHSQLRAEIAELQRQLQTRSAVP